MKPLDAKFLSRATSLTAFNLTAADFVKNDYKREIQTLYQLHMFFSFNPSKALRPGQLTKTSYNKLVKELKVDNKDQYDKLHNLSLKGIGPAEAVLFLLTRDGHLLGGRSAGADFADGAVKYEVKAVEWKSKTAKDYMSNFRLGGNINGMAQLEADVQKAMFSRGYVNNPSAAEIKGSLFQQFEKDDPVAYNALEERYQKLATGYFSGHQTIFIQNDSSQPDFGEIIVIKNIKEKDIKMERYTSRSIKPLVKA